MSNEKAKIPARQTVMLDLDSKFNKLKQKLIRKINNSNFVCLMADVWTNKARSFMGMSIHFLNDKLERELYLLAFRRLFGRHTYDVLAELILYPKSLT